MQRNKTVGHRPGWLTKLFLLALFAAAGLSAAPDLAAAAPSRHHPASRAAAVASSGRGQYYIEFRSRYAWDYGHTYLIHARVGERITKANVAGLSPVGDDATAWVIGHYVPVPAETGWTDGDIDERYVSARYRVYMDKAQYDRVVAYIKHLQATSHIWSAELYNCNAFVGDVAKYMGLRVPKSTLIYPKVFVSNLRRINTRPDLPDNLFQQNVKMMSNPTRDGRAMVNNGIYALQARKLATRPRAPSSSPRVIIGPVRASNRSSESIAASENSSQ